MSSPLQVAVEAALTAGQVILDGLAEGRQRKVRHKGRIDLVTEVDLAAETAIREVLAQHTPGIPVLAEEGGGATDVGTRWIVDPLDGTTNFVHGFPGFGVSIALQDGGELVAACIHEPLGARTHVAERGKGATCNGERLRVSEADQLVDALLLTGFAYDRREKADWYLRFVKAFLEQAQGLRRAGAAAIDLTHIAGGRADGYWEFGLNAWDVAAGVLLVEEAGGVVSDVSLAPLDLDRPRVLATNGRIHDQMAAVIDSLVHLDP